MDRTPGGTRRASSTATAGGRRAAPARPRRRRPAWGSGRWHVCQSGRSASRTRPRRSPKLVAASRRGRHHGQHAERLAADAQRRRAARAVGGSCGRDLGPGRPSRRRRRGAAAGRRSSRASPAHVALTTPDATRPTVCSAPETAAHASSGQAERLGELRPGRPLAIDVWRRECRVGHVRRAGGRVVEVVGRRPRGQEGEAVGDGVVGEQRRELVAAVARQDPDDEQPAELVGQRTARDVSGR